MRKMILRIILCLVTTLSFSQSKNWKFVDIKKSNFSKETLKLENLFQLILKCMN